MNENTINNDVTIGGRASVLTGFYREAEEKLRNAAT
jgi:hypothetical protein